MKTRILTYGLGLWVIGTVAIRFWGEHLLHAGNTSRVLLLYVVSFTLMALLARRIFSGLHVDREKWPQAATLLAFPTLLLDPFSCAFFPTVFPNLDAGAAGLFGGWMLICCGGAMAGAWTKS